MNALDDPRVTPSVGVSDEAYDIDTPDGIWDVFLDGGLFAVAGPQGRPDNDGDLSWIARLPHFGTVEEAVASVLVRY